MTGVLTFIIWGVIGYLFFLYLTHPKKKKNKLPKVKVWRVEVLPNFLIDTGSSIYWIHHWFLLVVIAGVLIFAIEEFQYTSATAGVFLGGIFQGLRYPDRFKFRYPKLPHSLVELQQNIHGLQEEIKTDLEGFQKEMAKINQNINDRLHPIKKKKE